MKIKQIAYMRQEIAPADCQDFCCTKLKNKVSHNPSTYSFSTSPPRMLVQMSGIRDSPTNIHNLPAQEIETIYLDIYYFCPYCGAKFE